MVMHSIYHKFDVVRKSGVIGHPREQYPREFTENFVTGKIPDLPPTIVLLPPHSQCLGRRNDAPKRKTV